MILSSSFFNKGRVFYYVDLILKYLIIIFRT